MILADSSALIAFLKDENPLADAVMEARARGQLVTNVIVRYEVLVGEHRIFDRARRLLNGLQCRILDFRTAERAIEAARALQRKGGPGAIGKRDTLIAGIALAYGDEVLTGNREHFDRVEGLKVHPAST